MPPSLLQLGRRVVRSITVGRTGSTGPTSHKGLILLYHRVASPACDPQQLCVSPENFIAHLQVLKQVACPLALNELLSPVSAGSGYGQGKSSAKADAPAVAVTFDDGYADNCWTARPILAEHGVPATVFVAAGYIDADREFWWDELESLLLHPGGLPRELSLTLAGETLTCDLNGAATCRPVDLAHHRDWAISHPNDPTPRHALYRALCHRLRPLAVATREHALNELFRWAGRERHVRNSHRALSSQELRKLACDDLIEIGAHTLHHSVLAALSDEAQEGEIAQSRRRLHEITGTPPTSFSYPFGTRHDFTRRTVRLVRSAGFARACANAPGVVGRGSDPFRLPRFVVRNWPADVFAQKIEEWLRG